MVKTRRKNDIKYPIINYKDSENNSFDYQPDEWEIEELLEELISENTTQDETGLVYINNDKNYTCNEDCFKEQLASYISEKVKELFVSYYEQIKERLKEEAMYEHSLTNANNVMCDSKIPSGINKIVNFDKKSLNNNRVKVLANKLDISIKNVTETELNISYGSFENIIELIRQLGIISDTQKISLDIYYNASSDIYTLDEILNKAEKTNVYLASYIFEEDIDFIRIVGSPENLNRFLEDTITNYSNQTIYIETTQDLIDEYSKQPLKFKSDKYLGEKDQKTMEELDALYKEYSEDDIDDVISSYGEFGASLKPLFNGKYTITFSKDKYKDTNIGVYDDLCKAWKSCFLFAITYNGNLEAFKKDDFYIENNIEEESIDEGEGRKNYSKERFGSKYVFKSNNNLPYNVRLYKGNTWLCEGKNQNDGTTQVLGSLNSFDYTKEEAEAYCKLAYKTFESLNFDRDAFKKSETYLKSKEIAKGTFNPNIETTSNEENDIYTLTWNVYVDDPFNDEFANENTFRNVARRLNVRVEEFKKSDEYEGEFFFKVSGKKQNILNFINVLFDFDFNNEQEEIDYLVREGYLKIANV